MPPVFLDDGDLADEDFALGFLGVGEEGDEGPLKEASLLIGRSDRETSRPVSQGRT